MSGLLQPVCKLIAQESNPSRGMPALKPLCTEMKAHLDDTVSSQISQLDSTHTEHLLVSCLLQASQVPRVLAQQQPSASTDHCQSPQDKVLLLHMPRTPASG